MKELSLHLLDIAQNALSAQARHVAVSVEEEGGTILLTVSDDGRGMSPEFLKTVTDPFTTTRTTRKVGLGLPLLRMAAELTGGGVDLSSRLGEGTTVTARFLAGHIDCPPLGDLAGTLSLLVQGLGEGVELTYVHRTGRGVFRLDTAELRAVLGPGVPLSTPEVARWVRSYAAEGEAGVGAEHETTSQSL